MENANNFILYDLFAADLFHRTALGWSSATNLAMIMQVLVLTRIILMSTRGKLYIYTHLHILS